MMNANIEDKIMYADGMSVYFTSEKFCADFALKAKEALNETDKD